MPDKELRIVIVDNAIVAIEGRCFPIDLHGLTILVEDHDHGDMVEIAKSDLIPLLEVALPFDVLAGICHDPDPIMQTRYLPPGAPLPT